MHVYYTILGFKPEHVNIIATGNICRPGKPAIMHRPVQNAGNG